MNFPNTCKNGLICKIDTSCKIAPNIYIYDIIYDNIWFS